MNQLPPPPPPPPPSSGRGPSTPGGGGPGGNPGERPRLPARRPAASMPKWMIWVVLGLLAAVFFGANLFSKDTSSKISFNDFLSKVKADQVSTATYNNQSGKIHGDLKDGTKYSTTAKLPISDDNETLIIAHVSKWAPDSPQPSWIMSWLPILLPFVFLVLIFVYFSRRQNSQATGIMSIGRSRAKAYSADKPSTTFADIAGYEGVKQEIKEVVDFLRMPDRFRDIGARVPKGILLVGPPGTGKTLFARAVAGEAGVGFLSVTGSDFMEMFVGVGASRVRDLFQTARKMGRAIIFVDEIDSIGRKRGAGLGGGHDEREQTLNQMLAEMDGFETSEGVVILAATNRPDILDPALLRPGRFDRTIVVPLPESEERLAILKVHSRDKRMAGDVDLEVMAKGTPGMSGADLSNLVNEAALFAVRRGSKQIERIDFESARDRVMMGARRESLILSAEEKRTTAYHEGGHALLATVLPNADPVHKVTILPTGMALGVTQQLPEERHSYSREYILDAICVFMGGRVAEDLVFAQRTTGAANDLERATNLAKRMVREWGMSDRLGPMAWETRGQVFLGEDLMTSGREYSDDTARLIDEEIGKILREQEQRARETLAKHRSGLDAIAAGLLERETIDGAEIGRLVHQAMGPAAEPSSTTPA